MSTAIMHQAPFYDLSDLLLLKNQGVMASAQAQAEHVSLARARSLGAAAELSQMFIRAVGMPQQPQQQPQQQPPQQPPSPQQQQSPVQTPQHRRLERAVSEPAPVAAPATPPNASRYKTELCRPYEEAGSCKYGDKCQFAHGYRELRNLQRHPKYKTELCRTFHSVGFCPYGPRCHFVHNAEEARANSQPSSTTGGGRPSLPSTPGSSPLSRSPTASVSSSFFVSPSVSPSNSPPPTPEEGRLPVFNRLMSIRDLAIA
ncbi:tis11 zinc finger protein [Arctopsyche grandis]|uniref:tis11 zinc finger protein n=1 Tax=Arctopsyche grandis TaxID=121162 RepID=UPI00406D8B05